MKVLLSIKPIYANKIFSGTKCFEYRKKIFQRNDIEKVIVYASAPISKVIGEFTFSDIIFEDINVLWEKTNKSSGISKKHYYEYFNECEKGYAICIESFTKYDKPLSLDEVYGKSAPQSFIYIE